MPCSSCNRKSGSASGRWEVTASNGVKTTYTTEYEARINASKVNGTVKKVA